MIDRNLLYKQAIDLWGEDAQLDMVIEECLELAHAIMKYKRKGDHQIPNIAEEVADVKIMLEQLELIFKHKHFGEYRHLVHLSTESKLERLEKRIQEARDA